MSFNPHQRQAYSTCRSVLLDFLNEHVSTYRWFWWTPPLWPYQHDLTSDTHKSLEISSAEIILLFCFILEEPPAVWLCLATSIWLQVFLFSDLCFSPLTWLFTLTFHGASDFSLFHQFVPSALWFSSWRFSSFLLSISSAIDTYIKFAGDKSRECAGRILISTLFLCLYPISYKMSHVQH